MIAENIYYVYQHVRLDKQEVFYIGIGRTKNYKRAYSKAGRNDHWKKIVGKTEYSVLILFDALTLQEACEKEIELIKLYGRVNTKTGKLCNMTDGGEGRAGTVISDELRQKLRMYRLGKKLPEAVVEKSRLSRTGQKYSEETIQRMRIAKQNMSDETKQKMSIAQTGRTLSQETKEKLRLLRLGKPRSEETKEKIRLSWIIRKQNKTDKKDDSGESNCKTDS